MLPEPHCELVDLPLVNKDELSEEGEVPEGTKITYKGEEYTLRKYGFFVVEGLRFRATVQPAAEGFTQTVVRAPPQEVHI